MKKMLNEECIFVEKIDRHTLSLMNSTNLPQAMRSIPCLDENIQKGKTICARLRVRPQYFLWDQKLTLYISTGCIKKNETGFLLNSSSNEVATYKNFSEQFQEVEILIPEFQISKLEMLILKIILLKYRHIKKDRNSISGYFLRVFWVLIV